MCRHFTASERSSFEETPHVLQLHFNESANSHASPIHLPSYVRDTHQHQQKEIKNLKCPVCLKTLLFFDVELSHGRVECVTYVNIRRNLQGSLCHFEH